MVVMMFTLALFSRLSFCRSVDFLWFYCPFSLSFSHSLFLSCLLSLFLSCSRSVCLSLELPFPKLCDNPSMPFFSNCDDASLLVRWFLNSLAPLYLAPRSLSQIRRTIAKNGSSIVPLTLPACEVSIQAIAAELHRQSRQIREFQGYAFETSTKR